MPKTCSEGRQQWEQIKMRIVRNTSAAVKFASQIPGRQTLSLKAFITTSTDDISFFFFFFFFFLHSKICRR